METFIKDKSGNFILSKEDEFIKDKPKMPIKGQIISLNVDGSSKPYRVLKIDGTVAEVLSMYGLPDKVYFSKTGSTTYANSTLDNYITTYYSNSYGPDKPAMIRKTFTQDDWYDNAKGNPVYTGYYGKTIPGTTKCTYSLRTSSYGSSITRLAYALSVQDVIDYITDTSVGDGKIQNYNVLKMFYNTTSIKPNYMSTWLRSANSEYLSSTWCIRADLGAITTGGVQYYPMPAFMIDLSKANWSIIE